MATELQQEIEDTLRNLYRITDHYVPLSQQGRFSEYDNVKEKIQEMADMFLAGADNEDKLIELQKKFTVLQEEIAMVSDDMHTIPDIAIGGEVVLSDNVAQQIDDSVQEAIDRLDKLADSSWEPYQKKKSKGTRVK